MIVRIPLGLDRDFAVDELAVVYPILNAIFDPIPIFAEEADSFVRAWIGQPHATRATPSIAHYLEANPAVCGFPFGAKEKFSAHHLYLKHHELNPPVFQKLRYARQSRAIFSIHNPLSRRCRLAGLLNLAH